MTASNTPGHSVRLVLSAQIESVAEEHIHEEGAPQVVDVRLTEAAMTHLAGLATWLSEASPAAASGFVIDLDPRCVAPAPGGERIPPPCFRGGAAHAYTGTGRLGDGDELDGRCEADESATLTLRLDANGDVTLRISALPYKQAEPGVLASETVAFRDVEALFAAAIDLRSPVAFTAEALDRATSWDLLDSGFGYDIVNYTAYEDALAKTTSFESVEDAAIAVLRAAGMCAACSKPAPLSA